MAHLGEAAGLNGLPVTDDGHGIAELFTSVKMWLESSTLRPSVAASRMQEVKTCSIQRVQARGLLIEQQQLCPRGQRGDQDDLLAVALGIAAGLLGGIKVEAFRQLVAALFIDLPVQL